MNYSLYNKLFFVVVILKVWCCYGDPAGAMEERRKNKNKMVHCPVCRASWPHSMMASPSGSFGPDVLPVSVPVGGAANEASGKVSGGGAGTVALSEEKALLLMSLKEVRGQQAVGVGIISPVLYRSVGALEFPHPPKSSSPPWRFCPFFCRVCTSFVLKEHDPCGQYTSRLPASFI